MLPLGLCTVKTPSCTTHVAGVRPLVLTHSSRFLPSKSTIASDGAGVGAAWSGDGVTIFGTGVQTSVSSGLGLSVDGAWAAATAGTRPATRANASEGIRLGMGRIL